MSLDRRAAAGLDSFAGGPGAVSEGEASPRRSAQEQKAQSLSPNTTNGQSTMARECCKHACCFCTPTHSCTRPIVIFKSSSNRVLEPGYTDGRSARQAPPTVARRGRGLQRLSGQYGEGAQYSTIWSPSAVNLAERKSAPTTWPCPAPRRPLRHASSRPAIQTALSAEQCLAVRRPANKGERHARRLTSSEEVGPSPGRIVRSVAVPLIWASPRWARSREYVPSHRLERR